jgi:hypothetical protein
MTAEATEQFRRMYSIHRENIGNLAKITYFDHAG